MAERYDMVYPDTSIAVLESFDELESSDPNITSEL
jgi:hypothetical protein